MSKWIRQFHRWVSIAFTLTVIANYVALGMRSGQQPPPLITDAPIMVVLLIGGLLLVVPLRDAC